MAELMQLVPANEDDYPNYPAIELYLIDGSYYVITISVGGEKEEKTECFNLIAALAYVTCVLARMSEIEYVVDTPN